MNISDRELGIEKLLKLLNELVKERYPNLNKVTISLDDHLEKKLGLDSLSRLELFSRIEDSFKVNISEKLIFEAQTAKDLLTAILGSESSSIIDNYLQRTLKNPKNSAILADKAKTLIEVLQWHSYKYPNRTHIQFYKDQGDGEAISYSQLYKRALKIAFGLQKLDLKPYQTVAIMLPTSADYFYSFFGILLAGAIPVPIYPPQRSAQLEEHMQRHTKILENAQVSILITLPEATKVASLLKAAVVDMQNIVTVSELISEKTSGITPQLKKDDIAFIQYTSGSTGDPKGVVLTHANLLANIRAMGKAVQAGPKDVFVSWLPLYHDMGLIGAWLGSLYHASLFVVMSPINFLAKPQRWLRAIHRYGGTLSAAPNFGYEYCFNRLKNKELKDLDLSSWRAAFNGAEAVSPSTIEKFSDYFSTFGFNPKSMTPVYGLAESSVGLTFPPLERGPLVDAVCRDTFMHKKQAKQISGSDSPSLHFVSSGIPLVEHQVRIVGDGGHELPERHEGNLQFHGPSSTQGYYKNSLKTQELIRNGWLNSGDRGYIANGELYVTGRSKDIIIRAGRNIYPDELEKSIGSINGIRSGCVAVFGIVSQITATERLVVLAETKIRDEIQKEKIRETINSLSLELIGGPPDEVVLVKPGTILKTSSGKIRRAANRDFYVQSAGKTKKTHSLLQFMRMGLKTISPQIQRLVRLIKSYLFAGYSWLIFAFLAPIIWALIVILPHQKLRWKTLALTSKFALFATKIPLKVNGIENIPKNSINTIIVANHASYIDSMVFLAALPIQVRFVAKKELKQNKLLYLALDKLETQFVERFDISESVNDSKNLFDQFDKGAPLFIFPEGTFTRIPGLKPFHLGAFNIAAQANAAIVPIAIQGTRSILRPLQWFPQYGQIHVEIGEPIRLTAEQEAQEQWHKTLFLSQKSREFILKHCGEPDLVQD